MDGPAIAAALRPETAEHVRAVTPVAAGTSQTRALVAEVPARLMEFMPIAFPGPSAGESPARSSGLDGVQDPHPPCVRGVVADLQTRRSALFDQP